MSNNMLQHEETRPEIDALLHEFFESEMPKPWPAFKAPKQPRMAKPSWTQYSGRLALAACVALLVAGYLTLGGFFSNPTTLEGVQQKTGEIGQFKKAEKR